MTDAVVTLWRIAVGTAALGAAGAVGAGFLGALHPAFDSLAHFRTHLAVAALAAGLVALLSGSGALRVAGVAAAVAGGVGLATTLPYVVPSGAMSAAAGSPTFTLLQMNMRYNADIGVALERIEALQPDVVTLQEVTARMTPALRAVAGYRAASCPELGTTYRSVVLSRHPDLGPQRCDTARLSVRRILLGGTAVTVVSSHLAWPWPHGQAAAIAAAAPVLRSLAGPVIVAGDFNAAPWSNAVRTVARLSGTRPVAGIGVTWPHGAFVPAAWTAWVGLALDNVLVSPDVHVAAARPGAATDSDHLPVIVRFVLRPSGDPLPSVAAN